MWDYVICRTTSKVTRQLKSHTTELTQSSLLWAFYRGLVISSGCGNSFLHWSLEKQLVWEIVTLFPSGHLSWCLTNPHLSDSKEFVLAVLSQSTVPFFVFRAFCAAFFPHPKLKFWVSFKRPWSKTCCMYFWWLFKTDLMCSRDDTLL